MLLWLEKRIQVKNFFLRPLCPRGLLLWLHFPIVLVFFLLVLQMIVGIFLALSCREIGDIQTISHFMRNLHRLGAHFLLVSSIVYILTQLYLGGYQNRGELLWCAGGIFFFLLCFAFCTGMILPWGEGAQKSLQAFSRILAQIPLLGSFLSALLGLEQKSPEATWHRFYVFHIGILPLMTTMIAILYLWLWQRRNIALSDAK